MLKANDVLLREDNVPVSLSAMKHETRKVESMSRKVYRHRLLAPGRLGPPELFVDTRCGGLTIDERGNVYLSTVDDRKGILVYAPNRRLLGQIPFPEPTTNAVFAGPDLQQLVVTTFKSIFVLPMSVIGMP